ncbi:MAG: ABC transporter substrate-binding protein [Rhodobacterales bacterium]|jgi:branched-chain amino acid transport system substrate-binding protein
MKKNQFAKAVVAALLGTSMLSVPAQAQESGPVKVGLLLGFTGPLESQTPTMGASVDMAAAEINASGAFLGGRTFEIIRGDSTCGDSAAAVAAATRLVESEGIVSIVGGLCSGASGAMLQAVARPNGLMMISPSATSPALSAVEDDNLFFRMSPTDARQGVVIANIMQENGISEAAITYTNNDYGKGLSDAIESAFTELGGTVTLNSAHEDGKGDYSAEVGALSAAGGEILVVVGYSDQGGKGIIQSALDSESFEKFFLPDAMVGNIIFDTFGADIDGSFGTVPGTGGASADAFNAMAAQAGFDVTVYTAEAYDATILTALAMQAVGTSDSSKAAEVVFEIANAPGEKIYPGEFAKAVEILAAGGQIDYEGASSVTLVGEGDAAGSYREILVDGGVDTTVRYRN